MVREHDSACGQAMGLFVNPLASRKVNWVIACLRTSKIGGL
jgi:hypothetical protein